MLVLSYKREERALTCIFEDEKDSISREKISIESYNIWRPKVLVNQNFLFDVFDFFFEVFFFDFDLIIFTFFMAYLRPVRLEIPNLTEAKEPVPKLASPSKIRSESFSILSLSEFGSFCMSLLPHVSLH